MAGEARWPTCQHLDYEDGDLVHDDHDEGNYADVEHDDDGHGNLPANILMINMEITLIVNKMVVRPVMATMTYLTVLAMCNFWSHEPNSATKSTL